METEQVTTYYLEMNNISQFAPKKGYSELVQIIEVPNHPILNSALFSAIGLPWKWYSRLSWSFSKWEEYFEQNPCKTYLGKYKNELIGYFELEKQAEENVEIKFFGLLPLYLGKGLGGHLLSHAINQAWQWKAQRIWVHTCSNDHKNAIRNYLSRGFSLYIESMETEQLPSKIENLSQITAFYSDYIDQVQKMN